MSTPKLQRNPKANANAKNRGCKDEAPKAEAEAVTKRPGPKYRTTKSRTTKCLSRHPTKAPATGRPSRTIWFAACRQWFAAASAEIRPAGLQEVQRLQLDPEGREAHQAQEALEGQQVQEGLLQKLAPVLGQTARFQKITRIGLENL